ncbi:DNA/RNA-binding protein KIN17 [Copidosoma floridanum]|uniref:DNA/RNA-binding protein KIN17 n=1 Tax=Copidosoma floridanum TaxID=29053 RepID=UPI0006C94CE2|nr:DNA/RNA-binding protein KIN17 [Copidosoma floridanum]
MGKHEVGTPKYIANKIKAKGLQKLRWYCQMCQKQCRDENGFKCHTMSESHHRQLLLFADNANKYMDQFSKEFSSGYLHLLKRQFGTKRVPANRVYQDYIADRQHVHMNATQWLTLTAYVKWLGRTGKCVVDETEKGWYITYIDRDPDAIAALEKKEKKEKMDKDDEERMLEFIQKQVKKGKTSEENGEEEEELRPLERPEDDAPLKLDIKMKPKKIVPMLFVKPLLDGKHGLDKSKSSKRKSIKSEEESHKKIKKEKNDSEEDEKAVGKDKGWLVVGISVKVVTKSLGEKYHKAKGTVEEIVDPDGFVGKVKLKSPDEVKGNLIKIDQEHLETVIPALDGQVMILKGKYRSKVGVLKKVRIDDFCADIELENGEKLLKRVPYEEFCKYVL